MKAGLSHLRALLSTPEGRRRLRVGVAHYALPATRPLARIYRRTFLRNSRIVAVVGSLGKTTTRRIAAAALGDSLDHHHRLVSAILSTAPGHPHLVFEVGIDHPGQMEPLARALQPDITVVTTIGHDHIRSLRTLETTRHEKAFMVRRLRREGLAVLNGDDPNVMWMAGETQARVVTYGLSESNDVRASDIRLEWPLGLRFDLHAGGETVRLQTSFVGRHFVHSFLAAATVALQEGRTLEQFADRVRSVTPARGRMHISRLPNGAVLLCDYFKASYESMHAALDTLSEVPARRRIVVFGDIDEPPGTPSATYGALGERIGAIATRGIFIGRGFRRYRAGASRRGMAKESLFDAGEFVKRAVSVLRDELGPGDVVLIKGRAEQRLDRIALALEGRSVGCPLLTCTLKSPRCYQCSRLENGPV